MISVLNNSNRVQYDCQRSVVRHLKKSHCANECVRSQCSLHSSSEKPWHERFWARGVSSSSEEEKEITDGPLCCELVGLGRAVSSGVTRLLLLPDEDDDSPSKLDRRVANSWSKSSMAFSMVATKHFLRSRVILACMRLRSRLYNNKI
jgi:hypothetical protein